MSLLSYFVIFLFTLQSVHTLQCYLSTIDGTGTVTTINSNNQTDSCNATTGCVCASFQSYCPDSTFCTSSELQNNVTKWFYALTDPISCSNRNQTNGVWNITCCSTDLCNNQGISGAAITTTTIANAATTTAIMNDDSATTTTITSAVGATTTTITSAVGATTTTTMSNGGTTTTTIMNNAITTTTTVVTSITNSTTTTPAVNTTISVTVTTKSSSPMILPSFTVSTALVALCFAKKLV
ncbi:unnamed protein product [Adineta ricciae]|uniref:Uncharacterized protein n=1 Tax=Adineta ricciae TaxID=249248 RepID=A0A814CKE7_ADIRI|nr:unnamed protein product [Adineta ricciae]CAF0990319.1 unnamed protein product [Adineta ricciae]